MENDCRNSAIPLLDMKGINARIEPGAIIREQVEIGNAAVIMMGAIINIGAVIGDGTMIDMGAVLGGRATVGQALACGRWCGAGRCDRARQRKARHCGGRRSGGRRMRWSSRACMWAKARLSPPAAWLSRTYPRARWWPVFPARVIKQKDEKTTQKTALPGRTAHPVSQRPGGAGLFL